MMRLGNYPLQMVGEFTGPSGRKLSEEDLCMLGLLHTTGSITREKDPVTLNGGSESHFYVRLRRELGNNPEVLLLFGQYLAKKIRDLPLLRGAQYNTIGIPTAGRPLAQAISLGDAATRPLLSLICSTEMRSQLKKGRHGIDGSTWAGLPAVDDYTYVTIENASTTGREIRKNLRRLDRDGFPTKEGMHHIIVIDRGGADKLKNAGYKHVHSIFTLGDIVTAFVQFRLWPRSHLVEYQAEEKLRAMSH